MIDHNHFICHFIFGGHLLNIPFYVQSARTFRRQRSCAFLEYSNTLFYFFYTADGGHFCGLRIGCFPGTVVEFGRFFSTK